MLSVLSFEELPWAWDTRVNMVGQLIQYRNGSRAVQASVCEPQFILSSGEGFKD